jgi:hypothetical protein
MGPPWPPTTDGRPGSRVTSPGLPPPPGPVAIRCVCVCFQKASSVAAQPRTPTKNAPPASCAGGAFGKAPGGVRGLHGSLPACAVHGVRRARGAPVHGQIGTGEERTPPLDDPRSPPMGFNRVPVSLHLSQSCAVRAPMALPVVPVCCVPVPRVSQLGPGRPSPIPGPRTPARGHPPDPAKKNRATVALTGRLAPVLPANGTRLPVSQGSLLILPCQPPGKRRPDFGLDSPTEVRPGAGTAHAGSPPRDPTGDRSWIRTLGVREARPAYFRTLGTVGALRPSAPPPVAPALELRTAPTRIGA